MITSQFFLSVVTSYAALISLKLIFKFKKKYIGFKKMRKMRKLKNTDI